MLDNIGPASSAQRPLFDPTPAPKRDKGTVDAGQGPGEYEIEALHDLDRRRRCEVDRAWFIQRDLISPCYSTDVIAH